MKIPALILEWNDYDAYIADMGEMILKSRNSINVISSTC